MNHPEARQVEWRMRLLAAGVVVLFVAGLVVVSQGRVPLMARFGALLALLLEALAGAGAWVVAAVGWGYLMRRLIGGRDSQRIGVGLIAQTTMGLGAMMLGDWCLGVEGLLNFYTASGLAAVGYVGLGWQFYHSLGQWNEPENWPTWPWPIVFAAPAAGLLIGAACLAPGGLWASEAYGYDVLSYHLQMSAEWIDTGQITGLEHNVYSFLPNLVEASYMHLGLWYGSMIDAAYATQMLHAMFTLIAAVAIGRIVDLYAGDRAGALAGALYLAVPWTIVTGSLAYNEQAVMALAGGALLTTLRRPDEAMSLMDAGRRGVVIGLLIGAAVLAKLTAAFMFAVPIALLLLIDRRGGTRTMLAHLAGYALAASLVFALWLIRNAVWTGGQPTFPFATNLFGTAHWSAEQADRWHTAHRPDTPLPAALAAAWHQIIAHFQFAYIVWPAALVAGLIALRDALLRRPAVCLLLMLAVQLLAWIFFTHHQSRFALVMLLPACILIALPLSDATRPRRLAARGLMLAVVAVTCLSFALYLNQREGQAPVYIDGTTWQTQLNAQAPVHTPATVINALPPTTRVYAEAFATPLYIRRPVDYHTVWDNSPLGDAFEAGGISGARQWLLDQGYTHVLIDWAMYQRWRAPQNYGYDPAVTPKRLTTLAQSILSPIQQWPTTILYRIR